MLVPEDKHLKNATSLEDDEYAFSDEMMEKCGRSRVTMRQGQILPKLPHLQESCFMDNVSSFLSRCYSFKKSLFQLFYIVQDLIKIIF